MEINTKYWDKDKESLKQEIQKMAWHMGICGLLNTAYLIFYSKGIISKILIGINLVYVLAMILTTISYNKRAKEEEQNDKRDKNRQRSKKKQSK